MKRPSYAYRVGQRVIRSYQPWAAPETCTIHTIEEVTPGGRAKIGDEVFLPDGRRLGDATRKSGGPWGSLPRVTISPATDEAIAGVQRDARVREMRSRCRGLADNIARTNMMTRDAARLAEALEHLEKAHAALLDKRASEQQGGGA